MVGSKVKLLVLDDKALDREIIKAACGILKTKCEDTESAQYLLDNYNQYDGIILDYVSSSTNCVELARKIRKKDPHFPIIFRASYIPGTGEFDAMFKYGRVIRKDIADRTLDILSEFIEDIKSQNK